MKTFVKTLVCLRLSYSNIIIFNYIYQPYDANYQQHVEKLMILAEEVVSPKCYDCYFLTNYLKLNKRNETLFHKQL